MSEIMTIPFKVKESTYKLIFSRALQLEYKNYVDEKKHDTAYQQEVAESERLEQRYKTVHEQFLIAESKYFKDILNEDIEKEYQKFEALDKKVYNEYATYIATHNSSANTVEFITYVMGKLVLLALKTQHNFTEKEAEELWNAYVEEVGDYKAMKFLVYVASAWVGDAEEEEETDPFIKAMEAKAERANNRRIGLSKARK